MKVLKCCLNWKVIAGLATVGVGFYAMAPSLAVAALPFLILAICPLSMMFMMKGMQGNEAREPGAAQEDNLPREERIDRLRTQRAVLTDRIADLEREEPQTARNIQAR